MDASILIRLIDQVTGPAAKVKKGLRGVSEAVTGIREGFGSAIRDGFSVENIETATRRAEESFQKAGQRLRGAVALGLALAAPVKGLADFEDRLVEFGNTAGIFGGALKQIETELRIIGPAVNKTAGEMLDALEYLVGKGLSPEQGMDAIRAIGMTATATKADIVDMSAASFSVLDNLKVPAHQLQLALDAMAQSGKSGGFELKGMAQYFPGLTASARALGMEGVGAVSELAAALQIAMKGAGDESTAANNMQNFLSKLSSPETVKRFKDMGVDIRAEFETASKNGVSVFEHMLMRINEITGGDQFKMGELFGDQQVLNFLKPMMQNLEEFKAIRDAALSADGINDADFVRVMSTANAKAKALVVEFGNLLAAGSPLLDMFKQAAGQLLLLVQAANAFTAENPELARQFVLGAAALMGLSIALRLAAFGMSGLRLLAINTAAAFLKFDANGRNIATGWRLIAGAGRLLAGSLGVVKAALGVMAGGLAGITAPVWAVVAALAAAGLVVWKFWDHVSSFVSGFASGIMDALAGLADAITGALGISPETVAGFKAAIADLFDFSGLIDGAKSLLSGFGDMMSGIFSQEKLSAEGKAAMAQTGREMAEALIESLGAFLKTAISPLYALFKFAVEIDWPEPPAWLQWIIDKGKGAVETASDFISGDEPAGAGGGGWGGPPAGDGLVSRIGNWWSGGAEEAAGRIEQGGARAGERLGSAANDRIASGAAAAGAALGRAAAAEIRKASVSVRTSGGASVGAAIAEAKAGALHEGTD